MRTHLHVGFDGDIPVAAVIEKSISNALNYGYGEYEGVLPWLVDWFQLTLFWLALWLGWEGSADFDDEIATGPFYGVGDDEYYGHKWLPIYFYLPCY